MSTFGDDLIQSLKEALARARGEGPAIVTPPWHPMACFCTAKTCLTGARSREHRALPRRTCAGSGRPGGRRR